VEAALERTWGYLELEHFGEGDFELLYFHLLFLGRGRKFQSVILKAAFPPNKLGLAVHAPALRVAQDGVDKLRATFYEPR
jgi:hypothetical protein